MDKKDLDGNLIFQKSRL